MSFEHIMVNNNFITSIFYVEKYPEYYDVYYRIKGHSLAKVCDN